MRFLSTAAARRGLVGLLTINVIGSTAAAVVLAMAPGAIPALAGISIDPSQNLLPYLLAAAELAVATLAANAMRSRSSELWAATVQVLIVLHVGSAVAGVAAATHGAALVVSLNVAVRILLVAGLMVCVASVRQV